MTFFRLWLIAAVLLACAAPGAKAQTSLGSLTLLTNGTNGSGQFQVGNDIFTVSNCTLSSFDTTSCGNLKIAATVFRGVVTFTVSNASSAASSIVTTNGKGTATLTLGITLAGTNGQNNYQSISKASTSITGNQSSSTSSVVVKGSFSVGTGTNLTPATLTDTLGVGTAQTQSSSTTGCCADTSGWTETETFSLTDAAAAATNNILSGSISFSKAPEPATLPILLLGIGGLAVARRRKRQA